MPWCFLNSGRITLKLKISRVKEHDIYLLDVDDFGAVALEGRHAPREEEDLAQPVEGDPASDEV